MADSWVSNDVSVVIHNYYPCHVYFSGFLCVSVYLASESSLAFPRDGAGTTKGHSFIHERAVEAGMVSYSNWSDEQSPRTWNKHVETWMFSHCTSAISPGFVCPLLFKAGNSNTESNCEDSQLKKICSNSNLHAFHTHSCVFSRTAFPVYMEHNR